MLKMKIRFNFKSVLVWAGICMLFIGALPAFAGSWSFGVMSDTQWTCPDDPGGENPHGVAVSIIRQLNQRFIYHGVKFVIQVGDLTEKGNDIDIATRAEAAGELILAGIGFFPMRGNHETYGKPANNFGIPAFRANFPQTRGLAHTFGANHFSSPAFVSTELNGMSYSFDYGTPGNNARFVILDNWATPGKSIVHDKVYNYGYSIGEQQQWISSRLDRNSRNTLHAFVFSHQPLIAENHQDSPFTGYTDANRPMQNAFLAALYNNDVKFYISGHDHIHQRSIIASPDGISKVQEVIGASNSSKFYTPRALNDSRWSGQKRREIPLAQERNTVGYYIYTVDGPQVRVDYYSDDRGNWQSDASYPSGPENAGTRITPVFKFVKKETWGYSLNGKEFLVCQNGQPDCNSSYTQIRDGFHGTTARVLDGTNSSKAVDYNLRPLTKSVYTGWANKEGWPERHRLHQPNCYNLLSNVFTIWGMADLGSNKTDTFVLSLNYDDWEQFPILTEDEVMLALVAENENGDWVNAVDLNTGGTKKFILGPWKPGYELGTYGIDRKTNTVWAIINYNGDFAVARDIRHEADQQR